MVVLILIRGPVRAKIAITRSTCEIPHMKARNGRTIFLLNKGFIDDIVIIGVKFEFIMVHIQLKLVDHWNKPIIVVRRT